MYQVILKPRAIKMQKSAYDWYEEQRHGLGELFLKELDEQYHKLQTLPTAYGKKDKLYRHLILRKFPFIIAYKIIGKSVLVYAVFHTSRHPKDMV